MSTANKVTESSAEHFLVPPTKEDAHITCRAIRRGSIGVSHAMRFHDRIDATAMLNCRNGEETPATIGITADEWDRS